MFETAPLPPSLFFTTVILLQLFGCDWGASPDANPSTHPSVQSEQPVKRPVEMIDADWVASKLQAPPAEVPKDWIREIEKDPLAALEQMDPGALQPRKDAPRRLGEPRSSPETIVPKSAIPYAPSEPLQGWPPQLGQFYPNLVLRDQNGDATAIGDLRGKVVLVELVGLTCRACHAFAGGNEPGATRFRGIQPQQGLDSIESYTRGYARLSLNHPDIVFVQLVLYGMDGRTAPSENDVRDWAAHFGMDRKANEIVLVGDRRFISPETRRLIPGFHLIDQNGILRAMSSNDPRHDRLHSDLLPKLASLVTDRR